ncbi:MAG: APC family permease [Candidatus Eremiobacteraeota bacterium]|nr:APC family permease [Candidatus Eremiobacteraeota bacterium]
MTSDDVLHETDALQLRRSLGLVDVTLFFIIAGSNLQWVATAAAAGPSSLPVWLIGAAGLFVPLAIVVVFLSSRYPDEGGLYVWSKRAFGPFAGFITGWTYWTSNLPYFPALLYFTAGNALFILGANTGSLSKSPLYFIVIALLGLALATALNVFGLDVGKWLNNIGAASRWLTTLLLIALGALAWWRFGPATHITVHTMRPGLHVKDLVFWSTIAFAWTGLEAVSFMSGEIKDPRRTVPRGLAIAAPVIAAIYLLGTASVLAALPPQKVSGLYGVMQAVGHVATSNGWFFLTPIAAILVTISCLGSVGAWLGAVARIPFVAGIDRYLPEAFGKMHPRWGSPVAPLLTQAAIAGLVIILSQGGTTVAGAYDVLVSTTVLITMLPFLFLFASAIKLCGERSAENGVRSAAGRLTISAAAAVGLLTTLISMALATLPAADEPNKAFAVTKIIGMTAIMVGSGVAVFVIGGRRKRAADLQDSATIPGL